MPNETPELQQELTSIKSRLNALEREVFHGSPENKPFLTPHEESQEPAPPNALIEWLKTDWLMKLGAFLLILALGWFVRYAFVNNWIGPIGRISMGMIVGAAIMAFGHGLMPTRRTPGHVLTVTGGVMILLTVFAARSIYGFFTPTTALIMMFLVIVAMAVIAIVHESKAVAILALLGGAIVPLLTHSPEPNYIGLMHYFLILDLGACAVVATRGWRVLIPLALFITAIYGEASFNRIDTQSTVWIFMGLFYLLFFSANLIAILRTKKALVNDLFTTGVNGLWLLWNIYDYVPREWQSIVLSGVIVLLVGVGYVLMQNSELKHPLYLYSGLAVVFLGAATAFELRGEHAALIIAYALEAAILFYLSALIFRDIKITRRISLIQIIPFILTWASIDLYRWNQAALFSKYFFVLLITILSLATTAFLLKKAQDTASETTWIASSQGAAGAILGIILIWLFLEKAFAGASLSYAIDWAHGIALFIYSIIGVVILFQGTRVDKKAMRVVGGILLGGVVVRLLTIEIWRMELSGRIITFVAIGILLVSTAFFQKRLQR